MNLFINALSKNSCFLLFDESKNILDTHNFSIAGNESSLFIELLSKYLTTHNLQFSDIKNFIVVNGPGSFTGVRTIVLAINTICFITKANITDISYFDLFSDYPIIKASSKRDCFFKKDKDSNIEILNNNDILRDYSDQTLFGEAHLEQIKILQNIDYSSIIQTIQYKKQHKIEALYIKKPNIS